MAANSEALLICREYSEDKLTTKVKTKTRKPMVEKLRRDRINSSINQLRNLLEREFQLLQPDSKPEKADILEITVQFLKQQIHFHSVDDISVKRKVHQQYNQGYAKCLHETLSFLTGHRIEENTQVKILNHFHQLESHLRVHCQDRNSINKVASQKKQAMTSDVTPLWRPW
ncbi:transcription factor HES-5-like [Bombina bombina]|uniref:transcription factor HES-5-like n=1 Tax=Bombina bombina TaxID=8345 RepID=UPI00235A9F2D|nr:transcription factor HES-5-like [Bombina bombina]